MKAKVSSPLYDIRNWVKGFFYRFSHFHLEEFLSSLLCSSSSTNLLFYYENNYFFFKKKKKTTTTTIEEKHLSDIYCWIQRITKIQKYICHPGVKISSQGVNFHLSKCSPISEIPKRYSFCRPPIKANIRCNIKSMGRKVYSLCIACTS